MSPYNQNSLLVAVIILGIGVVGALVGAAQFRSASPSRFDKDTAIFIIKMFAGIPTVLISAAETGNLEY